MDKYEASVWSQSPDANGNPRGTQFGVTNDNYPCSDNGNDCSKNKPGKIFAVSAPGKTPSRYITWFQAQQACTNVGKRLLRNGEWQMAAAGTPEVNKFGVPLCNTETFSAKSTGSYPACVSNWGVFDMVGNLWEWVEDWMQDNSDIDNRDISSALYDSDVILGIDEAFSVLDRFPAAINRGGSFDYGSDAGVFAFNACCAPSGSDDAVGFRCAK